MEGSTGTVRLRSPSCRTTGETQSQTTRIRASRIAWCALVVALMAGGLSCRRGAGERRGIERARGGQIAFVCEQQKKRAIYLMNADGSRRRSLAASQGEDWSPVWSPDGNKIAFLSGRDVKEHPEVGMEPEHQREVQHSEVYVMNADGTAVTRLSHIEGRKGTPAWSPDGERIAFTASVPEEGGGIVIYVVNADGTGLKALTERGGLAYQPAWSPDGKKIAFGLYQDTGMDIYLMNADGSGRTRLTNAPRANGGAVWSPDGSRRRPPRRGRRDWGAVGRCSR